MNTEQYQNRDLPYASEASLENSVEAEWLDRDIPFPKGRAGIIMGFAILRVEGSEEEPRYRAVCEGCGVSTQILPEKVASEACTAHNKEYHPHRFEPYNYSPKPGLFSRLKFWGNKS